MPVSKDTRLARDCQLIKCFEELILMETIKKTICPLDCPDSCGMLATVRDGRVVSVNGDPEHPYTDGFICRKMRRYPERLYSGDRILYPQVRAGRKGEGRFKRISWDEAWDYLVPRMQTLLRNHGGDCILPFSYAGNMGKVNRFAGFPLFNRMGTLDTRQTICSATASGGWKLVCGTAGGTPPSVAAVSELIVAWGINIRVSNVHFWRYVKEARARGARLLVIDPYENDTARLADDFIKVNPGGDCALALAVLKIMIDRKELDYQFIERETEGFDRLSDYLGKTDMGRFELQCGVCSEDMGMIATLLAKSPKTFIRIGVGLTRNSRGGMAVRGICSLAAALGLFDGGEGRGVLLFSGAFSADETKLTFPELARKQRTIVNMIHLGQVLNASEQKVRALIVYNANPVSVVPDGGQVRAALCRDDLLVVVHEQVMTPTAWFADLLLPATTFLENRDVYSSYGHFYLGVADRVIDPVGEAMSNFDFFQEMARRMGYDEEPFCQGLEERMSGYLETLEGAPGDLAGDWSTGSTAYIESIYNDPQKALSRRKNKRFRFVNEDDPARPSFACLTGSTEFDHPDLCCRFPLKLITPPDDRLLNSTFGEMHRDRTGRVLIHPEDAKRYGIVDGSDICLLNFRGRAARKAVVTGKTQKGLLVAEGIYWPTQRGNGGGINDLVSQQVSDVGEGPLFHESRVRIEPLASD